MTEPLIDAAPLALRALDFVPDGSIVGLGTGHAAEAFLLALATRVRGGLRVRGVPTSSSTEREARRLGVPLIPIAEVSSIDIAVDGADEVAPTGDLIKGYGGALLREKIVASLARRLLILVGEEKLVPFLGQRGRLPVEVVLSAIAPAKRAIASLGFQAEVRMVNAEEFATDNGNRILDVAVGQLSDPAGLDAALRSIPGLVGTGLFLDFRPTVLIQSGFAVREWNPVSD